MSARHSWFWMREHTYMCRKCGAGKVNEQRGSMQWAQIWSLPDGTNRELRHAPPCEPGEKTAARLARLADWIAKYGIPEKPKKNGESVQAGDSAEATL